MKNNSSSGSSSNEDSNSPQRGHSPKGESPKGGDTLEQELRSNDEHPSLIGPNENPNTNLQQQ